MKRVIKKLVNGPVDWFLYSVLNEQQRGKLTGALSDNQKEMIKRLIQGKNQAKRQKLKQIKYHLYNLGFIDRAYQELESFYREEKDPSVKRLAAWELALWHANQYTETGAKQALIFIEDAKHKEKDKNQLRRIAIVEAECLDLIGDKPKAKGTIHEMLENQQHPDLYLAAANLEESSEKRLRWINQALGLYELTPITLETEENRVAVYDDIRTESIRRKVTDGPKVSIILPAFKAEDGVQIAIESILNQTWQNIELLAVDDCSPDRTAEVIQAYEKKDPRVKFLKTPINSGPYVARNIALQAATGEFVTVNDADDWSHAEKIETQVLHLMNHPEVIANTSQLARVTEEDLKFYRRGTPGKYIFPNMSSMMFRRKPVIEKLGSWDSVRFAADGEFKRRLIQAFGKEKYVDLDSGPLSLPRQAVASLTSSSAFGYNGFFMGVRKEYVESFSLYHEEARDLVYEFPQKNRPFPVPEPMWPNREEKPSGRRQFDIVIATDFRIKNALSLKEIMKQKAAGKQIGLMQLNAYDLNASKEIDKEVRSMLDESQIQMLVYGEKITADTLIVIDPKLLEDKQKYIPDVDAANVYVVISETPTEKDKIGARLKHMTSYFGAVGNWIAKDTTIRQLFLQYHPDETEIQLANETWETGIHDK